VPLYAIYEARGESEPFPFCLCFAGLPVRDQPSGQAWSASDGGTWPPYAPAKDVEKAYPIVCQLLIGLQSGSYAEPMVTTTAYSAYQK
jgi:hypothetical protein